jgi:hypothetical protein
LIAIKWLSNEYFIIYLINLPFKKFYRSVQPSLDIKELQIKITLRFHLTPVRTARIKGNSNTCTPMFIPKPSFGNDPGALQLME